MTVRPQVQAGRSRQALDMMAIFTGYATAFFAKPFNIESTGSGLFIERAGKPHLEQPLHIHGVNWAGFQRDGCPHELWRADRSVPSYIAFSSRILQCS